MRSGMGATIDTRLEELLVAWARRQWPILRLVPARWIRPAVAPTAARLRRGVSRGALVVVVCVAFIFTVLSLVR